MRLLPGSSAPEPANKQTLDDVASITDTLGGMRPLMKSSLRVVSVSHAERGPHHAKALGSEFIYPQATVCPKVTKTSLLSHFHASWFCFGFAQRAEPPKPLPCQEVSEPRGGGA